MKINLDNCTLQDFWENGHHKSFWIENETGIKIADACEIYRISYEEHFEAAENIKQIFELAEYLGSFPDDRGDPNIIAIHRLQKDIELSNGRKCIAYITLKEVKKAGNKIYTQELLLNKYPPHEAGELMSRGLQASETTAYKCSPRTVLNIPQDPNGVK